MRSGFGRDSQAAGLGIAHHVSRLLGAHVEDVKLGAEGLGKE